MNHSLHKGEQGSQSACKKRKAETSPLINSTDSSLQKNRKLLQIIPQISNSDEFLISDFDKVSAIMDKVDEVVDNESDFSSDTSDESDDLEDEGEEGEEEEESSEEDSGAEYSDDDGFDTSDEEGNSAPYLVTTINEQKDKEPTEGNEECQNAVKEVIEEESQETEDDDDEPCCICGKFDDAARTLLCDGCDLPFHMRCVGVLVLPDNDWFCNECNTDHDDEAEVREIPFISRLRIAG